MRCHRAPASSHIDFAGSPRPTLGVEWEFALVDAETRDVSNEAAGVIEELGENNPHVHKELLRNTVEIVTGICDSVPEAMDDLRATLATARQIVRDRGMELFCAGTHPFAKWSPGSLTDAPRYAELIKRTQWWGRQMLIWGVHVHVGISSAHKVMAINTSLLNHYPHLLALSASSPFWDGEDTGYASNRAMMFQQLPTAGLPFHFQTWAEWEGFVYDQKKTGIIDHMNEIRWDIRPSPHMGTVEVRIFDGVSNIRELSALVALTHCLIVDLDRRLDAGERLPTMPPWHVQENKWRAARYGLDAVIILDADSNERLVTDDLDELLNRLEPVAKSLKLRRRTAAVADHLPVGCVLPTPAPGRRGERRRSACGGRRAGRRAGHLRRCRSQPMFPLEVAMLPGEELPLRIFEPRYTALVSDCLAADDPAFGVVLIAAGREVGGGDARSDVGALAHIAECADFGDGRYRLRCVMGERIRVVEWQPDDPYPRAAVELWPDEPGEAVDVRRDPGHRGPDDRAVRADRARPAERRWSGRDIVAGADASGDAGDVAVRVGHPASRWDRPTGTRCSPRPVPPRGWRRSARRWRRSPRWSSSSCRSRPR